MTRFPITSAQPFACIPVSHLFIFVSWKETSVACRSRSHTFGPCLGCTTGRFRTSTSAAFAASAVMSKDKKGSQWHVEHPQERSC